MIILEDRHKYVFEYYPETTLVKQYGDYIVDNRGLMFYYAKEFCLDYRENVKDKVRSCSPYPFMPYWFRGANLCNMAKDKNNTTEYSVNIFYQYAESHDYLLITANDAGISSGAIYYATIEGVCIGRKIYDNIVILLRFVSVETLIKNNCTIALRAIDKARELESCIILRRNNFKKT